MNDDKEILERLRTMRHLAADASRNLGKLAAHIVALRQKALDQQRAGLPVSDPIQPIAAEFYQATKDARELIRHFDTWVQSRG